jgi:hypothetical protein
VCRRGGFGRCCGVPVRPAGRVTRWLCPPCTPTASSPGGSLRDDPAHWRSLA